MGFAVTPGEVKGLKDAILQARAWGLGDEVSSEQLADLMQAIHDIPLVIQSGGELGFDGVKSSLEAYDQKWTKSADDEPGYLEIFDRAVRWTNEQDGEC